MRMEAGPFASPLFFVHRGETITDHRLEGRLDQLAHQFGRRVIRAGGLAFGAGHETEAGPTGVVHVHGRVEFQQALVNRAQLLDIERGVVDPARHTGRAFLVPGQPP